MMFINIRRLLRWKFNPNYYAGWTWEKIEEITEDAVTSYWFHFTNGKVHAYDYFIDYEFSEPLDNDKDRAISTIKYKSIFWEMNGN